MSRLRGRLRRLERKTGLGDEPVIIKAHDGFTLILSEKEFEELLAEVAKNGRPLVQEKR